ncbi:hypothetical protein RVR_2601 [Actinacidiphila reveromycinica]|uniref:Htaa domain-containing protein n=1 Tax=Actinacidiphila reveromycinica TaxID=659352 RepID=A0A7U3VMY6_9ACTN|nr:hypothetical protein RVR_2601 [Streptomyces sp. SN-593]
MSVLALVLALAAAFLVRAQSAFASTVAVSDASFVWGLDATASAGAYFGGCNFLSAGAAGDTGSSVVWTQSSPSPGYAARVGNVSVEKPDTAGTYGLASWATRCQGPDGGAVSTSTNTGSRVRIVGGSGTVDPSANTASVQWEGSFTSAFYGGMVYWTATDPKLTVNADGSGEVTATLGGYGADMNDASKWAALPATVVTLAELSGVEVTDSGFTVAPSYRGVEVSVPGGGAGQYRSGADWGSWPQSFVDFQQLTGESSYWYSSNLADADKVAAPLTVGWPALPSGSPGDPTGTPASPGTPTDAGPPTASGTPTAGGTPTASGSPTAPASGGPSGTPAGGSPSAQGCTLSDGVKGGSLVWGFKESFRSYVVSGGSANSITAGDGARVLDQDLAVAGKAASGTFLWPYASSSSYTGPAGFTVQYGGKVEFSYPAHLFDIVIEDPEVVVKGTSGTLYADVSLTVTENGKADTDARDHVALASLDLGDSGPAESADGITLVAHTAIQDTDAFTFDGSAFYQKGQALDDATVLLSGCTGTRTGGASAGGASGGSASGGSPTGSDTDGGVIPTVQYRPGALASTGAAIGLPLAASLAALAVGAALVGSVRLRVRRRRG